MATDTEWAMFFFIIASLVVGAIYFIKALQTPGRKVEEELFALNDEDTFNFDFKEAEAYIQLRSETDDNNVLRKGLMQRAIAAIDKVWILQKAKSSIDPKVAPPEVWAGYQNATKTMNDEIHDITTEAETLKMGWGKTIIGQAANILACTRKKQMKEVMVKNAEKRRRDEEKRLNQERKRLAREEEQTRIAKARKAEKAYQELMKSTSSVEAKSKSKKKNKHSAGAQAKKASKKKKALSKKND